MTERDEKGKFLQGNQAAIGHRNKTAQKRQRLSAAFLRQITLDDFAEITQKLIENCKNGDIQSLKLFFERTLGKLEPTVEITEAETRHITIKLPPGLEDL